MFSERVLLVDDEEEFVAALSERLMLRGIQVETALCGEDAIAIMQANPADLIILDVMMPVLSGLEVLKRIKASHPKSQVILLTGHGATKEGIEGMRLGAFDYLIKPVDLDELLNKMREAIASRQTG
jgi:DNA-binding response OmpR family regulator